MARLSKIGKHATLNGNENGMYYTQYHATKVVKWNSNRIILNSGGWRTNTTKTRMNQTSNQFNLGFNVFQKDFEWFVKHNGEILDFSDNMELSR